MSNGILKDRDALAAQGPRVATELLRSKGVLPLIEEQAEVLLIPEWSGLSSAGGGGAVNSPATVMWNARRAIRDPVAGDVAGDINVAESGGANDPAQTNAVLNDFAGEVIVNFRTDDPNMAFTNTGTGAVLSGTGTNRLRGLTESNGEFELICTTTTVGTVRITFSVEDRPSLDIRVLDITFS